MRSVPALLSILLVTSLAAAGYAAEQAGKKADAAHIVIKDAWVLEVPPSNEMSAAYMKIENSSAKASTLVTAETDASRVVELHKMSDDNGMMKMEKVNQIQVPAKGSVALEPGGLHLMLIGLQRKLKEGDEVTFTLRFQDGAEEKVVAPVRKRTRMH
jgi:copper(I)-binding protein